MAQVEWAVAELERQRTQVSLSGRRCCSTSSCRLRSGSRPRRGARLRRRHPRGTGPPPRRGRRRQAHGPRHPGHHLRHRCAASRRAAYVGVDNRAAGATAAYLVTSWARHEGPVLVTLSSSSFYGEEERVAGFRTAMADLAPLSTIHEVTDTDGLDATMRAAVRGTLGRTPEVFVAHDLDADNRRLLRTRRISAVLHHDLRADMRRACRLLLQARDVLPGSLASVPSQIQVVTPFNEPSALLVDRD